MNNYSDPLYSLPIENEAPQFNPNDLNLINEFYYSRPDVFSEEEVDTLEKTNKALNIDFKRINKASDDNLFVSIGRALGNVVDGFVSGFTTLGNDFVEDKTTVDKIASSIGHLLGFIGIVPGVGSIGSILAKGITRGVGLASKGINLVKGAKSVERGYKLADKALKIKSVPMAFADAMSKYTKVAKASESATNFITNKLAGTLGKEVAGKVGLGVGSMIKSGVHLGYAQAISSWSHGDTWEEKADNIMNAFQTALIDGAVFGAIGNILPSKYLPNVAKDGLFKTIIKAGKDPRLLARALSGSIYMGLHNDPDQPIELDIYNYLLGAWFGGMEPSGVQRKAFEVLSKHRNKLNERVNKLDVNLNKKYAGMYLLDESRIEGFDKLHPEVKEEIRNQLKLNMERTFAVKNEKGLIEFTETGIQLSRDVDDIYNKLKEKIGEEFKEGKITHEEYQKKMEELLGGFQLPMEEETFNKYYALEKKKIEKELQDELIPEERKQELLSMATENAMDLTRKELSKNAEQYINFAEKIKVENLKKSLAEEEAIQELNNLLYDDVITYAEKKEINSYYLTSGAVPEIAKQIVSEGKRFNKKDADVLKLFNEKQKEIIDLLSVSKDKQFEEVLKEIELRSGVKFGDDDLGRRLLRKAWVNVNRLEPFPVYRIEVNKNGVFVNQHYYDDKGNKVMDFKERPFLEDVMKEVMGDEFKVGSIKYYKEGNKETERIFNNIKTKEDYDRLKESLYKNGLVLSSGVKDKHELAFYPQIIVPDGTKKKFSNKLVSNEINDLGVRPLKTYKVEDIKAPEDATAIDTERLPKKKVAELKKVKDAFNDILRENKRALPYTDNILIKMVENYLLEHPVDLNTPISTNDTRTYKDVYREWIDSVVDFIKEGHSVESLVNMKVEDTPFAKAYHQITFKGLLKKFSPLIKSHFGTKASSIKTAPSIGKKEYTYLYSASEYKKLIEKTLHELRAEGLDLTKDWKKFLSNFNEGIAYDKIEVLNFYNNFELYRLANKMTMKEYIKFLHEGKLLNSPAKLNKRISLLMNGFPRVTEEYMPKDANGGLRNVTVTGTSKHHTLAEGIPDPEFWVADDNGILKKLKYDTHFDGVVYLRSDVFEAIAKQYGLETKTGAQKGTILSTADGKGIYMGKLAYHRASETMDKAMLKKGIHSITYTTASKQIGLRDVYEHTFTKDGDIKFFKGDKEITENLGEVLPFDAFTITEGNGEHLHEQLKDISIKSQAFSNSSMDKTPELTKFLNKKIDEAFFGIEEENKKYEEFARGNVDVDIDVTKLSFENKLKILNSGEPNKPFVDLVAHLTKYLKQIEREDAIHVNDSEDILRNMTKKNITSAQRIFDLMQGVEITPALMRSRPLRKYFKTVMESALKKSIIRPISEGSWTSIFMPYRGDLMHKIYNELGRHIKQGEVLISTSLLDKKIKFMGEKIPIGEALKRYKEETDPIKREVMQDDLTIITQRVPTDDISGLRKLKIVGTTDIPGTGIVLHPEDMVSSGGADLDIDKGFVYTEFPKEVKSEIEKHKDNLFRYVRGEEGEKFEEVNINKIKDENEKKNLKKIFIDPKSNNPFEVKQDKKEFTIFDTFKPYELFEVAKSSAEGKDLLGPGINTTKVLAPLLNHFQIDERKKKEFARLKVALINSSADASNGTKLVSKEEVKEIFLNTLFGKNNDLKNEARKLANKLADVNRLITKGIYKEKESQVDPETFEEVVITRYKQGDLQTTTKLLKKLYEDLPKSVADTPFFYMGKVLSEANVKYKPAPYMNSNFKENLREAFNIFKNHEELSKYGRISLGAFNDFKRTDTFKKLYREDPQSANEMYDEILSQDIMDVVSAKRILDVIDDTMDKRIIDDIVETVDINKRKILETFDKETKLSKEEIKEIREKVNKDMETYAKNLEPYRKVIETLWLSSLRPQKERLGKYITDKDILNAYFSSNIDTWAFESKWVRGSTIREIFQEFNNLVYKLNGQPITEDILRDAYNKYIDDDYVNSTIKHVTNYNILKENYTNIITEKIKQSSKGFENNIIDESLKKEIDKASDAIKEYFINYAPENFKNIQSLILGSQYSMKEKAQMEYQGVKSPLMLSPKEYIEFADMLRKVMTGKNIPPEIKKRYYFLFPKAVADKIEGLDGTLTSKFVPVETRSGEFVLGQAKIFDSFLGVNNRIHHYTQTLIEQNQNKIQDEHDNNIVTILERQLNDIQDGLGTKLFSYAIRFRERNKGRVFDSEHLILKQSEHKKVKELHKEIAENSDVVFEVGTKGKSKYDNGIPINMNKITKEEISQLADEILKLSKDGKINLGIIGNKYFKLKLKNAEGDKVGKAKKELVNRATKFFTLLEKELNAKANKNLNQVVDTIITNGNVGLEEAFTNVALGRKMRVFAYTLKNFVREDFLGGKSYRETERNYRKRLVGNNYKVEAKIYEEEYKKIKPELAKLLRDKTPHYIPYFNKRMTNKEIFHTINDEVTRLSKEFYDKYITAEKNIKLLESEGIVESDGLIHMELFKSYLRNAYAENSVPYLGQDFLQHVYWQERLENGTLNPIYDLMHEFKLKDKVMQTYNELKEAGAEGLKFIEVAKSVIKESQEYNNWIAGNVEYSGDALIKLRAFAEERNYKLNELSENERIKKIRILLKDSDKFLHRYKERKDNVDFDSYYPHMDFDEDAVKEFIKKKFEKRKVGSEQELIEEKINAINEIARGDEVTNTPIDEWDLILGKEYPLESALEFISPLSGNIRSRSKKDPTPGWSVSTEVLKKYQTKMVRTFYTGLASFMARTNIADFEKAQPFGEMTKAWARFGHIINMANTGRPSVYPDEWINDRNLKIKGNPFYYFTDHAHKGWIERISKKWFADKDFFNKELFEKYFQKGIVLNDKGELKHKDARMKMLLNNLWDIEVSKKLHYINNLDAKWNLVSLLTHTKTMVNNMIGGTTTTMASTGSRYWLKAGNPDYLLKNIFPEFKDYKDIITFIEQNGGLESMFKNEMLLSGKFRTGKLKEFYNDYVSYMKRKEKEKNWVPKLAKKHFGENWQNFLEVAGWFMRKTEASLRTRSWLAHYIRAKELLSLNGLSLEYNHPWLIEMANKGVAGTQYLYNNANRPVFATTHLGKIYSRFQLWTWNSMAFRNTVYKSAMSMGVNTNSGEYDRLRRIMTADLFILALAGVFPSSVFESTLAPPFAWLQDLADFFFGDSEERERAFYGALPYPANIVQPISPPSSRIVFNTLNFLISQDFDKLQYQVASWLPFGRLGSSIYRTFKSPIMVVDNFTGVPLTKIHKKLSKIYKESKKEEENNEEMR